GRAGPAEADSDAIPVLLRFRRNRPATKRPDRIILPPQSPGPGHNLSASHTALLWCLAETDGGRSQPANARTGFRLRPEETSHTGRRNRGPVHSPDRFAAEPAGHNPAAPDIPANKLPAHTQSPSAG